MNINSIVLYKDKYFYIAKTYKNMSGMFGIKELFPSNKPKKNCIIVHNIFLKLVKE